MSTMLALLLNVVCILTPVIVVPVVVNARRKRRGEERRHSALAITIVILLAAAALAATAAIQFAGLAWWISLLSAFSFSASWIRLLVMLSRGVPRPTAVRSGPDDYDLDRVGDFGLQGGPDPSSRPKASWLEITAQVSGILSLVVAVIALFMS